MSAIAQIVAHVSSSNLAAPTVTQTMSKRNQHVIPSNDGSAIRSAGAKRDTGHFDRKQDAIDRAREISQNLGTELIVHGRDGQIQSKDSHGHDPFPLKG